MDSRLTAEQVALRDAATAIGRDHAAKTVADLGDPERSARLYSALDNAGLFELRDGDGEGAAASGVEVALVAEALGHRAAEVPYIGRILASDLLRRAGVQAPAQRPTLTLGADLSAIASSAESGGVVFDSGGARSALVLVEENGEVRLGVVGVHAVELATDLTRPFGRPQGTPEVVGEALSGDTLQRWRAFAQATLAADLLGTLTAAHAMTLSYACDRQQYGRAIGSFQAVQHLMADSLVWLEGARSVVQYASWAVDEEDTAIASEAALVAKVYTSLAAQAVCEIAIQVHGGIGNTWECMVHVHLRRAVVSAQVLGSEDALLEELADRRLGSQVGLPR